MANHTMIQYFEWYLPDDGSLWRQCEAKAQELKALGFDMIWLPPAYKGTGRGDVGYGVYDLYDLGEFDQKGTVRTKYGTREEYLRAVRALQRAGLRVLTDMVLNHRMGADACETVEATERAENNREQQTGGSRSILAWTRFTFPGRAGKYSSFVWDKDCFSGTDWDEKEKRKGLYLFSGKSWNRETDDEKGNYDYLMGSDLDTDNPAVAAELQNWARWYFDTVGMDGVRLDAVKHISFDFYREWLRALRAYAAENGKEELFAVGEYWHADLWHLTHYLDAVQNSMFLFDVPLHYNFFHASREGGYYDMRGLFANSLVKERPQQAVTFVDNHDTQAGQALCSDVQGWFKPIAYASILLREGGIPCVFYGDLYGIPHAGAAPVAELPLLLKLRERYAYGAQTDYFDHHDVVGWVRHGDEAHEDSGMAVLVSDGPQGKKRMLMGGRFAGMRFYDAVGRCTEPVTLDSDGWGTFGVSGGSVSVWVCGDAYRELKGGAAQA